MHTGNLLCAHDCVITCLLLIGQSMLCMALKVAILQSQSLDWSWWSALNSNWPAMSKCSGEQEIANLINVVKMWGMYHTFNFSVKWYTWVKCWQQVAFHSVHLLVDLYMLRFQKRIHCISTHSFHATLYLQQLWCLQVLFTANYQCCHVLLLLWILSLDNFAKGWHVLLLQIHCFSSKI